jgi:hypothetical protein
MAENLEMKKYEIFWLIFMSIVSIAVGWTYALHQTDVHHWGFIAGTALDYIRGRELYSDMYVQYGAGQPILFKFLNHFLPVNYTSIGIISDFIYALNLIVIYFGVRKLSSALWAVAITAAALCIHSFPVYPWPDYYGGLFLSLGCFSLIHKKDDTGGRFAVLSGLFLFIAFIFRNTYLINLFAAFFTYSVFSLFFRQIRNKKIFISMAVFISMAIAYFAFLYLQGNLHHWFLETLETSQSQYGVFSAEPILKLLGHVFLPLKPWLPANLVTTTWSFLFYLGFFCIGISLFKKNHTLVKKTEPEPGILLILSLIGLAGTIQTMVIWEGFRLQNACSPLYFVFAVFIFNYFPDLKMALKSRKFQIAFLFYFVILAARFPHGSTLWPLYDGRLESYSESKIPYFKFHRFGVEEEAYYTDMRKYLCDGQRKIINLTLDSTIPFLCEGQKNGLVLPFFIENFEMKLNPKKAEDIKIGFFTADEVIVSDGPMVANLAIKLVETATLMRPASTRWWGRTPVRIYHAESIQKN